METEADDGDEGSNSKIYFVVEKEELVAEGDD